ncbi:MAG: PepSY domain-containing protein [Lachnospiraceae bacterium]|nr:PepSY domain-containing protein [Lachnospiraceae bacterium]
MRTQKSAQKLADILQKVTPDSYKELRLACGFSDQEKVPAPAPANTRTRRRFYPAAAGIPALAAAALALWLTGSGPFLPLSTVTLDVNPSVSLEVTSKNKVRSATALNEDGELILEGMDLKGTDVTVAVNALIGAMVQAGYLNEMENSILLGVSGADEETAGELQNELMRTARKTFSEEPFDGAVLSTIIVTEDSAVTELAEAYGISAGKASVALELASQSSSLTAEDVAQMSVNDINLLISSQNYTLTDLSSQGTASQQAYMTEEEALALAWEYSSYCEEDAEYTCVLMDYNSGAVTYEVEFYVDAYKYEYEMNALTGELLEWEMEWKTDELLAIELEELEKSLAVTGIGEEQALAIALEHAGVDTSELIFQSTCPSYEDGQESYEVEFYTDTREYEYKIGVTDGEILEYTVYQPSEE